MKWARGGPGANVLLEKSEKGQNSRLLQSEKSTITIIAISDCRKPKKRGQKSVVGRNDLPFSSHFHLISLKRHTALFRRV